MKYELEAVRLYWLDEHMPASIRSLKIGDRVSLCLSVDDPAILFQVTDRDEEGVWLVPIEEGEGHGA